MVEEWKPSEKGTQGTQLKTQLFWTHQALLHTPMMCVGCYLMKDNVTQKRPESFRWLPKSSHCHHHLPNKRTTDSKRAQKAARENGIYVGVISKDEVKVSSWSSIWYLFGYYRSHCAYSLHSYFQLWFTLHYDFAIFKCHLVVLALKSVWVHLRINRTPSVERPRIMHFRPPPIPSIGSALKRGKRVDCVAVGMGWIGGVAEEIGMSVLTNTSQSYGVMLSRRPSLPFHCPHTCNPCHT